MTIEDELTRTLERRLGALDPGGADLGGARRQGRTLRRRRRLGVGAVVAATLALVGGLTLLPEPGRRADPVAPRPSAGLPAPEGRWTALPDLPNGARFGQTMAWTGSELIVAGGGTTYAADGHGSSRTGAAYDPRTDRWQVIADSPRLIPAGTEVYATGRYVVYLADQTWLAYDSVADRWATLPPPPPPVPGADATAGGRLVYLSDVSGRISALDPETRRWTRLPVDPRAGELLSRPQDLPGISGYDGGVVATGDRGRADVWDGTRWTVRTQKGRGYVDPAHGNWARVPTPPGPGGADLLAVDGAAVGSSPYVTAGFYLWDTRSEQWRYPGFPELTAVSSERVWVSGRLYQVGGVMETADGRATGRLSDRAWVWSAD